MVRWKVAVLAAAIASGCATTGSQNAAVSDEDFAKLQASQAASLDEARQAVMRANDEQARAQLRLTEAQTENQLAESEVKAAEVANEQAGLKQQLATQGSDPRATEEARGLVAHADAQRRAADAHVAYAQRLVSAREAAAALAEHEKAAAEAKLELAKVQALRQAGVQTSEPYDLGAFQQRVRTAEADVGAARRAALDQQWWARQAQRTYGDAQGDLRGTGTPRPEETGTGAGTK